MLTSCRESGAILGYLIMRYDPERKISATTEQDKALELQWMSFQISEVAPYYGQAFWFTHYHPEHLPSAIARYKREIVRMFGVLDGVLAEQEWLVGGRPSVADFSFIMCVVVHQFHFALTQECDRWNELASPQFVGGPEEPFDIEGKFPHYYAYVSESIWYCCRECSHAFMVVGYKSCVLVPAS